MARGVSRLKEPWCSASEILLSALRLYLHVCLFLLDPLAALLLLENICYNHGC
jgi:hypothetical protein